MEKTKFAKAALASFDRGLGLSYKENLAIKSFMSDFEEELELNNKETLLSRLNFFKIPQTKTEDYKQYFFKIKDGCYVLSGIRHVSGNVNFPFVMLWPNYTIDSYQKLDEVIEAVVPRFKIFNPKYVVFWHNPHSDFGKKLNKKEELSSQVLIGDVQKLKELPKDGLKHYSSLHLEPITNNSYRPWYEKTSEHFKKSEPSLKDWVMRNDVKTMEQSIREGLIYFAKKDDEIVGLISAEKQNILGFSGCYFTDIVVDPKFKGKGYAPSIQRKFIEALPKSYEVVWGTIDAKNTPSTKTALRVGRNIIRTEYFIPLVSGMRGSKR